MLASTTTITHKASTVKGQPTPTQFPSLSNVFSKYVLSAYYTPVTVPGTGEILMNKRKILALMELTLTPGEEGQTDNNQ